MKPTRGQAPRGRLSLRETIAQNQQALDLYAAMSGKPRYVIPTQAEPVRRASVAKPTNAAPVPLEKDVQKAIIDGLRVHPMVGLVERVNSGTAVESNADGSQRHISFHHVYSVAGVERMRSVDVHATLKGAGIGGRRFVIEVKRPGWKAPHGTREIEQANYLAHVRSLGGFGMFAMSWDEVAAELCRIRAEAGKPQWG